MNNDKKLSIIIPTYKGKDSLPIALQSLVEQTYKNIEVIVSDDNGLNTIDQKETQKVIERFKNKLNILYLINEHVNGSHARNKGLEVAKGDYISFLDDDDFYLNDYAQNVVDAFNRNVDVKMIFFDVAIITKEKVSRAVSNESINCKELLFGKKEIGTGSNICFKKEVINNDIKFDERYRRHQDIEFVVKSLNKNKSIWINELMIVKYYNKVDNYPDFDKAIQMQELLRSDMREKCIISESEENNLINIQLHSLYHDMLARNANINDISKVYSIIKENNMNSMMDRALLFVYSFSKSVFNFIYRSLMSNKTNNINYNELLNYRNMLENNSR